MIKEAMLYEPLEGGKVVCNLCAHRCQIPQGKWGICGVRENREGKLRTHAYGEVIAAHVDPIEKKPLFHYLPGTTSFSIATVGCNFRCPFCQNWEISQSSKKDAPGERGYKLLPRMSSGKPRTAAAAAFPIHTRSRRSFLNMLTTPPNSPNRPAWAIISSRTGS